MIKYPNIYRVSRKKWTYTLNAYISPFYIRSAWNFNPMAFSHRWWKFHKYSIWKSFENYCLDFCICKSVNSFAFKVWLWDLHFESNDNFSDMFKYMTRRLVLLIPWQCIKLFEWDWTHQSHGIQALKSSYINEIFTTNLPITTYLPLG